MNNIKKGFSLVELLISLIVISCITAAFAPLITKKFSSSVFGFGGGGGNTSTPSISADCSSKFSSDCLLCTSSECLSCAKTCPDGQCQDSTNCTCKECPTSEYPNCIKFTNTACIQCKNGYRLVDSTCIACPNGKYSDNGKECKYCEIGYWPNDDKTACVECPKGYICNQDTQVKCSENTAPTLENGSHICAPCPEGSYCKDGVEEKCSDKFKNCEICNGTGCTKCAEGTLLSEGRCIESMDDVIQIGNLYVTKFNMGDKPNFTIPSTVTILTAGSSAGVCDSGKCCWKGTTSQSCNSYNGGYNGCTRTVCNWEAAREICARFDLNGESWRLPTQAEMNGWDAYTVGQDVAGLQLCNLNSTTQNTYATCYQSTRCYGSYNRNCIPGYVWSNQKYESGNYFYAYVSYLNNQSWSTSNTAMGSAATVRCVATVSDCPKGQFKNSSTCTDCSSKFAHCEACTSSQCTTCESGYDLHPYNNKCYKVIEDAVPVDNLYITKFNMGDGGLPVASTVSVVNAGSACTSGKCCWRGNTTSGDCDNVNTSDNGGYSGCTRTVCNWYAAKDICDSYKAGGKTWRLPNYSEMANWYKYTISLGAAGPQICDWYGTNSSYGVTGCRDNSYYPSMIWAQSYNTTNAYYYQLYRGSWSRSSRDKNNAQSVRCVTAIDYD